MSVPDARAENGCAVFALADGLAGRPDPEQAAHEAVQTFLGGFTSAPGTWGAEKAVQESFAAANHALIHAPERGSAAALSTLVLQPRRWLIGHAGDTRVWLMRDRQLKLLTRDHLIPSLSRQLQFSKAVGLEAGLDADIAAGELGDGDVFVLTSSGVHDVLDTPTILGCLLTDVSAQQMAEAMTQKAHDAGKRENVRACVVRVLQQSRKGHAGAEQDLASLPMMALPVIGDAVDGWRIEELVQKSSRYRLYLARDEDGRNAVLKFPSPKYGDDAGFIEGFLREEWVARRLDSPHLVKALAPPGRRRALYTVTAYHPGESLSERIKRNRSLPVTEVQQLSRQLLDIEELLQRAGVAHPDIRPKNLLFDRKSRQLKLLNPGASLIGHRREPDGTARVSAGSLSYLAPELIEGRDAGTRSDVYTAGVVIYRMLTGKFPYGRIKSVNHAAYGAFVPPSTYNPEVPPWLDECLRRACAFDPEGRYESAAALAKALASGGLQEIVRSPVAPPAPPAAKRRLVTWEWTLVAALVAALLAYLALTL